MDSDINGAIYLFLLSSLFLNGNWLIIFSLSLSTKTQSDKQNKQDLNNNNILMIAAEHGHLAIFEVYATKFPRVVEMSNKKGWTALTTAARYGAIGMVEVSFCFR